MNDLNEINFAKELYLKYNFPTFIKSVVAKDKTFDYLINGSEFIYMVFTDNTFISIFFYTEDGVMQVDSDCDATKHPLNFIADFKGRYPAANREFDDFHELAKDKGKRDWKLKQYEKLKLELGL